MSNPLALFPPWNFGHWEQVDDSVRGGSSVSHLVPYALPEADAETLDEKSGGAKFTGNLDIKTLGGAGFASQRYTFASPLNIPPSNKGILLRLSHTVPPTRTSPTHFTLTLANTPRVRLPSGRTASRLQYEADFEAPVPRLSEGVSIMDRGVDIILPFDKFEATYRGRRVERGDEKWAPLRTEEIVDVSIMCRSGFGKQEGEFEVRVLAVEAYGEGLVRWWEVWRWCALLWVWLGARVWRTPRF